MLVSKRSKHKIAQEPNLPLAAIFGFCLFICDKKKQRLPICFFSSSSFQLKSNLLSFKHKLSVKWYDNDIQLNAMQIPSLMIINNSKMLVKLVVHF